jgi:hypothetical protein
MLLFAIPNRVNSSVLEGCVAILCPAAVAPRFSPTRIYPACYAARSCAKNTLIAAGHAG